MLAHVERGVQRITERLGLSENLALLDRAWESELGGVARLARIVALERLPAAAGASLVVEADSAPAMQEISLRRKELVRRLNRHFPEEFIKHITVRISQHG